jgi:hypothetical protein
MCIPYVGTYFTSVFGLPREEMSVSQDYQGILSSYSSLSCGRGL